MVRKTVVILGAGITGLSIGHTLSSNEMDVHIIERDNKVGGIIKGFKVGKYTFDHGPHAILTRNKAAFKQFKSLIKDDLISIGERRGGIYFKGRNYEYPLKPTAIFRHSSPIQTAKILLSFVFYNAKRIVARSKEETFEEYIQNHFGKELYKQFFENYTKKVWGFRPSTLAASFAAERIPKISLADLYKNLFAGKKPDKNSAEFSENMMYYPKKGVGEIPELLEMEIKKNHGKIYLNSAVSRINLEKDTVKSIEIISDGKEITIHGDYFVSTIPISSMVKALKPAPDKDIINAANSLKFKEIKFLFLVVNKKKVFDEHWVYFHDDDNVFYRIFDTSSFSDCLVPEGKCGLIIELSTNVFKKNEDLYRETIKGLESYNLIKEEDIEGHWFDELEHGYPIYSVDYKKNLNVIFEELNKIKNLITAGRQGLFRYLDMDHCIRFGPVVLDIINKKSNSKIMDEIVATHGKRSY